MFAILLTLAVSIWLVRQGRYRLHKRLQIGATSLLVLAVVIFEFDIRLVTDWRELAKPSPYFESGWVFTSLYCHLAFSIPTPVIWGTVIVLALRHFEKNPRPNSHSQFHRRLGWFAVCMMVMTSITGWFFYYLAFVAS